MVTPTPDSLQESLERRLYRWYSTIVQRLVLLVEHGEYNRRQAGRDDAHESAHAIHGWQKALKIADHSGLTRQLSTRICDEIAGVPW